MNAAATTAVFAPLHAQADPTAAWADAIYAINPGHDADLQKLRDWSLRFLDSGWAELATQHGWSAVEAWGIFPGSLDFARRRGDALGLVPALALGQLTGKLIELGPRWAMIERTSNGARLRHTRRLGSAEWSIPWFEFNSAKGMQ